MAFTALPVPVPGTSTFNVDAQQFASGMADFAQEANSIGSVIDLSLKSSSTTSLTIGTGSKTLTVQTGLGYIIGHPVRIASVASPSNFMDGIVTAYTTGTGLLTVSVASVGGTGTFASWNTMVLPGGGNFAGLSNNKFTGRQVLADEVTVASASTVDFTAGNSNQFLITGTTSISAVTMDHGAVIKAKFSGACTLTHGSGLQVQGGSSYTTAAGDVVTFTSNGTVVTAEISKFNGTAIVAPSVTTLTTDPTFLDNDSSPTSSDWSHGLIRQIFVLQHQAASGTDGGSISAATWTSRPLVSYQNTISGASVSSSAVTLPAGTYSIAGYATGFGGGSHRCRIRQTSGTTVSILGGSVTNGTSSGSASVVAEKIITLAATTVLVMEHWRTNTQTGNGLGSAVGSGDAEVFAELVIKKL